MVTISFTDLALAEAQFLTMTLQAYRSGQAFEWRPDAPEETATASTDAPDQQDAETVSPPQKEKPKRTRKAKTPPPAVVTRDMVRDAFTALGKQDVAAARAALSQHGLTRFADIKEEQYAAVYATLDA
jgi:hypothetical protein